MTTFGGEHEVRILGASRHGFWPECRCSWLGRSYTTNSGASLAFGMHLLQAARERAAREAAEEHYGEPVVRLQRAGMVLWAPRSLVERVRAEREAERRAREEPVAEAALTDGPACVCDALPYEHGWVDGRCYSVGPKPPLGGIPIFDPHGPGIIGRHPAPAPVRP